MKKIKVDSLLDCNKEILFDLMEKEKIEKFEVTFDGGGDDGQIDAIDLPDDFLGKTVFGARVSTGSTWTNGKPTITWKSDPSVEEIIDNICYEVLEGQHSGWENGEGARGNFVFDLKSRTVEFAFHERVMDYDSRYYKF